MITTHSGLPIATGFIRIVHGGRGDYVEFDKAQMVHENLTQGCQCKPVARHRYFIEYRSNDDNSIMVYYQLRQVAYADYKRGYYYISPALLLIDGHRMNQEQLAMFQGEQE